MEPPPLEARVLGGPPTTQSNRICLSAQQPGDGITVPSDSGAIPENAITQRCLTVPVLADPHSPSACDVGSGVSALQRCIGPAASAATAIGKAGKGGRGGGEPAEEQEKGGIERKKNRKKENKRAVRKFSLCRVELHPDGAGHEMLHIFSPFWC